MAFYKVWAIILPTVEGLGSRITAILLILERGFRLSTFTDVGIQTNQSPIAGVGHEGVKNSGFRWFMI